MEGEDLFGDGPNASGAKVGEGERVSQNEHNGNDGNGGDGTGAEVESVVGSETGEKTKSAELFLNALQFRDHSIQSFVRQAQIKYINGQLEHGGYLPNESSFAEIKAEIIDMWFYVEALEVKVHKLTSPENRKTIFNARKS